MPDYTVKDTQTGKTVTFRWDGAQPPTEADMADVFAAARSQASQAAPEPKQAPTMAGYQAMTDVATGALKGAANTAIGAGQLVRAIPGVGSAIDSALDLVYPNTRVSGDEAMVTAKREVQPTNTAQRIGYTGEQVGEFFTPLDKAGKAAKAIEVAKAGIIGSAQGGPAAGATSAALTAVIPGGGAAKRAASMLERSAEKSVAQALGATKEWAKTDAAKLAPEMIARGVKGSRAAMQAEAEAASRAAGERLGAAYKAAGEAGETISGVVVQTELELARKALMVRDALGRSAVVPGTQRVVKRLKELEDFAATMGDDIPVDKAAKIKTAWDRIVAKSGLYGPKAAANATDSADAWAIREGASSIRKLLAESNPEIAALNKEYAFWTGLRNVLRETEKRTQAQGPGLTATIAGSSGGTLGAVATALGGGGATEALSAGVLTGMAAKQLTKLMQSPYWKTTVSAPLKQSMANALAGGSPTQVSAILSKMLAAVPPQARAAFAQ